MFMEKQMFCHWISCVGSWKIEWWVRCDILFILIKTNRAKKKNAQRERNEKKKPTKNAYTHRNVKCHTEFYVFVSIVVLFKAARLAGTTFMFKNRMNYCRMRKTNSSQNSLCWENSLTFSQTHLFTCLWIVDVRDVWMSLFSMAPTQSSGLTCLHLFCVYVQKTRTTKAQKHQIHSIYVQINIEIARTTQHILTHLYKSSTKENHRNEYIYIKCYPWFN